MTIAMTATVVVVVWPQIEPIPIHKIIAAAGVLFVELCPFCVFFSLLAFHKLIVIISSRRSQVLSSPIRSLESS